MRVVETVFYARAKEGKYRQTDGGASVLTLTFSYCPLVVAHIYVSNKTYKRITFVPLHVERWKPIELLFLEWGVTPCWNTVQWRVEQTIRMFIIVHQRQFVNVVYRLHLVLSHQAKSPRILPRGLYDLMRIVYPRMPVRDEY
ncbi:hypothetical protein FGB62_32g138 [Gracilaria domingensis]|nr:hypothetical protein FGB62_32g138 [Gracilaria domingensis]